MSQWLFEELAYSGFIKRLNYIILKTSTVNNLRHRSGKGKSEFINVHFIQVHLTLNNKRIQEVK